MTIDCFIQVRYEDTAIERRFGGRVSRSTMGFPCQPLAYNISVDLYNR